LKQPLISKTQYYMCLSVFSSVLWCPLRFSHENDVLFDFTSSCLSYLCGLFSFSGVQHVLTIWTTWLIRGGMNCLAFASTCVHLRFLVGSCCILFCVSGLSILDCPFDFLWRLLIICQLLLVIHRAEVSLTRGLANTQPIISSNVPKIPCTTIPFLINIFYYLWPTICTIQIQTKQKNKAMITLAWQ
jgi:hypothetical protein